MLALRPNSVTLDSLPLEHVAHIIIDRAAESLIEEWDDTGPHAAFVDVAQQRTTIKVTHTVETGALAGFAVPAPPALGASVTLTFETALAGGDGARRRITASAVVTALKHDVTASLTTRTITLIAASASGTSDPIAIEEV